MSKEEVRVIIFGLGHVGLGLVADLNERIGIKIVGAIDTDPTLVGKDAGELAGCGPIGVKVTDDAVGLYQSVKADVVLGVAASRGAKLTFLQMRPALENGINVIVANSGTCQLWSAEHDLAVEIDKVCKENGVSYFGIGSSQVLERIVVFLTEGSANIDSISLTHHADVHAFSHDSNKYTLGIFMTPEEFDKRFHSKKQEEKSDATEDFPIWEESIRYMCKQIGWTIDRFDHQLNYELGDDGLVYKTIETVKGFENGVERMEQNWIFVMDPEKRYYDRVVIKGKPMVDATLDYTPDRGICTTFATIKNAIPNVIKAAPGYISTLDVPACSLVVDDYRNHC